MKTPSRRHPAAFTLIELMAVVTIIVILAGIVVAGLGFVNEKQAREKAKVQIGMLERAIEEYKMDMGDYPGSANVGGSAGDVSQILYQALFKEGFDYTNPANPPASWTKATKIYIPELDPRNSKVGWVKSTNADMPSVNLKITDPWGNNYRYRRGSSAQNPDFDLWSMGKDGRSNFTNPSMSEDANKDDIRNF